MKVFPSLSLILPHLFSPQSYYCNCEKREERNRLLKSVQHAIEDLRHVEKARIRTLGSTLHTTFSDDEEGPGGSLTNSHELLNSMTMSSSMQVSRLEQYVHSSWSCISDVCYVCARVCVHQ